MLIICKICALLKISSLFLFCIFVLLKQRPHLAFHIVNTFSKMRLYLFVSVIESGNTTIKESATGIESSGTFEDLLKASRPIADIPDVNIQVYFQTHNSSTWHAINNGIHEDLEMAVQLGVRHVKFIWNNINNEVLLINYHPLKIHFNS